MSIVIIIVPTVITLIGSHWVFVIQHFLLFRPNISLRTDALISRCLMRIRTHRFCGIHLVQYIIIIIQHHQYRLQIARVNSTSAREVYSHIVHTQELVLCQSIRIKIIGIFISCNHLNVSKQQSNTQ